MPEPDPQPPQPRSVSPARWLSLLTPSAFTIAVPLIFEAFAKLHGSLRPAYPFGLLLLNLTAGFALSFVFGFFLEKWRWGGIENDFRALGYGFLILIVNTFTSYAGCTSFTDVFKV
jgi:hypothetical protein